MECASTLYLLAVFLYLSHGGLQGQLGFLLSILSLPSPGQQEALRELVLGYMVASLATRDAREILERNDESHLMPHRPGLDW